MSGNNAFQAAHNINDVYRTKTSNERTAFDDRFRSRHFDLENEPRGRHENKFSTDAIRVECNNGIGFVSSYG